LCKSQYNIVSDMHILKLRTAKFCFINKYIRKLIITYFWKKILSLFLLRPYKYKNQTYIILFFLQIKIE
jgi:hypothetical protein